MAKIAKIKSLIFDCFSVSSADGLATIAKNKRFLSHFCSQNDLNDVQQRAEKEHLLQRKNIS